MLAIAIKGFLDNEYEKKDVNLTVNPIRINFLILLNIILIIFFTALTQFFLKDVNTYMVLTGRVIPEKLELGLMNSPVGINGVLQLLAFSSLILFQLSSTQTKSLFYKWAAFAFSFVALISQLKIKGVLFLLSALFFYKKRPRRKALVSLSCGIIFFCLLFFVTRLIRWQTNKLDPSLDSFLTLVLGFYTGSPFFNTNYILDHLNIVKEHDDFFRYLIPTRLFHGDLMQQQLPDLSSPSGLFGSALLLGEIYLAMIYLAAIGFLTTGFMFLMRTRAALKLFFPFLMVACAFSFIHDYFVNYMYFWVPFFLCVIFSKYLIDKS